MLQLQIAACTVLPQLLSYWIIKTMDRKYPLISASCKPSCFSKNKPKPKQQKKTEQHKTWKDSQEGNEFFTAEAKTQYKD